jgi:hypothetical protein
MFAIPLLCVTLLGPNAAPPSRGREVSAADVRRGIERSLPFLEKSSSAWRTERKCVTCHQVPFGIWALHDAKGRGFAVDAVKLDDLTKWAFEFCVKDEHKGEKTGGFHLTMTFMTLSQGAEPRADALAAYKFFEPLFAKRQKPDGSWREGRQIRLEGAPREADEVDTMWTVLAIRSMERLGDKLPAETRKGLAREREKGQAFLKGAKPGRRIDWLALRILVAEQGDRAELVAELRKQQNPDGGWGYVRGGASYPHTTGESLYALGTIGLTGDDPAVRRAWKYLLGTQRPDGSWKALSRETFDSQPEKTHGPSVHWGTAWATLGLVRTFPR